MLLYCITFWVLHFATLWTTNAKTSDLGLSSNDTSATFVWSDSILKIFWWYVSALVMIIIVDPMIFWNMWAAQRIEFFHAAESLLLWNAEPMGFNLAVWDNHVANNQHSFHPVFTMSFYHCSRPKRPPLPFVALYSQNFCWLVYSNQKYIL